MTTFTISAIEKTTGERIEIGFAPTIEEANIIERNADATGEYIGIRVEEVAQVEASEVESTEADEVVIVEETLSEKIDRAGKLIVAAIDGAFRGLVYGFLTFTCGIC